MQNIDTGLKGLQEIAKYAGGSIPQSSDAQYAEWLGWLSQGQEDAAERGFWSRLLTPVSFSITKDAEYDSLPADFHKRNGIYVLDVDGVDWNEANNSDGQRLFVNKAADGTWKVYYRGFAPTATATGTLWYFRHPGLISSETSKFILDGKMCVFYALAEYGRQAGELGSLDDARAEYNNRFEEALSLEMLPSPQELLAWKPYYSHANVSTDERAYYTRDRRRT